MEKLTRRQFLKLMPISTAVINFSSILACENQKHPKKPNIIFLLTDDQRWDTMGCMGNSIIQTPNMDALAADGVLFTNNFVTYSYCAPSRASIITGMYYSRHGIAIKRNFTPSIFAKTYPVLLREAGYYTGFIGKWGMGATKKDQFDYFWGFAGQGKYWHEINGKKIHLTRLIERKTLDFINNRQKNKPFCLSVSFKAPHVQGEAPDQFLYDPIYKNLYRNVIIPVPKTADPNYFEALPEFIKNSEARVRWHMRFSTPPKYQKMVKGYYRLITGIDNAIGKIMGTLEKLGLKDNTVVIFTGDNGFFLGEHGLAGKWLMYEESIRTPLIINDPRLPKSLQGQRRKEMTLNIDIAPTILDLAGVETPNVMQGKSLCPLLKNESTKWKEDWFYQHYAYGGNPRKTEVYIPQSEGVRSRRWKYIRYIDQQPPFEQLFDLENDPHEINNLAKDQNYRSILDKMRDRWQVLRMEVR